MRFRNCLIVLLAVGLMFGSARTVRAQGVPLPAPVAVVSSSMAGALVAGGIIGAAAALCIYDVSLKINGLKNWDGTPKVARMHHTHQTSSDSLGDLDQRQMYVMQQYKDQKNQLETMISNILKALNDTMSSLVGNLKQ